MILRLALSLAVCYCATFAFAQPNERVVCPATEVLVPITYQFKDSFARASWVYDAMSSSMKVGQRSLWPRGRKVSDGALSLHYCLPTDQLSERFTVLFGPRSMDLAARPVVKDAKGADQMTEIIVQDQPKPDWVVLKSVERLAPAGGGLPSYEVELFNFGDTHPGGRVRFRTGSHRWSCFANSPGSRVSVQVSLSGQRLRLSSSDPQYPEEQVERQAELRSGYCGGNFDVSADLGPTGPLPTGPTRIRYALKPIKADSAGRNELSSRGPLGLSTPLLPQEFLGLERYFSGAEGFEIAVAGEGIWPR